MKNTLKFIDKNKLSKLQKEYKADYLQVIIDGTKICSWSDYWDAISNAFSFSDLPSYMKPDYHSYYDLMTDLSWLKKENIIIIIENAEDFLKDDTNLKNNIIKDFQEYLLPFWEDEVSKTVVNGERKIFLVYLVNNL